MSDDLSRRAAIKLGAAATVAASIEVSEAAAQAVAAAARPATFFTRAELALVDELSEMIIPTDDHSPGARAAKVAAYLDGRLAEAFDPADRTTWREGLRRLEQLSRKTAGRAFLDSSPEQRLALLQTIAASESKPETPDAQFFVELKSRVVQAYYTSEIGIKQELEYKGNTYQAEFAGVDVSER